MLRIGHVVVAAATLVAGPGSALAQGWWGNVVEADWLFPGPTSVLESHDVLVGPAVELPPSLIVGQDNFSIDLGPDTVQFNFNAAAFWSEAMFNGWRFSDVNGTIPVITGYALDAVSAGIGNVGSIITSFGADHVQADFSGITVVGDGDFIRLKVTFAAPPTAWTNLGSSLAGASGDPLLEGSGTMEDGSQNVLDLSNAAPNAVAILFAAPSTLPTPFKGGIVLPDPIYPPTYGMTDASGTIRFRFILPAGMPSGSQAWVQWGIQDAAAVEGVSLSNAVEGVKP